MLDDNFAKKIETDTLTKAISKLGFNADIFLGKFDDVRYLNEVKEEFKPKVEKPALPNDRFLKAVQAINDKKITKDSLNKFALTTQQLTVLKELN